MPPTREDEPQKIHDVHAQTLEFILRRQGPLKEIGWPAEDHGIARAHFFGERVFVIYGVEGQQTVLQATQEGNVEPWYDVIKGMFQSGMFFLRGEEWEFQRNIVNRALNGAHITKYIQTAQQICDQHLLLLDKGKTIHFYNMAQQITFSNACSAFLGLDQYNPRISALLWDWKRFALGVLDLSGSGLLGTSYRARKRMDKVLYEIIREKKQNPGDDFVSAYVEARRKDGSAMGDKEIVQALRFIIYAAYDTTANSISWAVQEFLRPENKVFHDMVLDEVRRYLEDHPAGANTPEELKRMPYIAKFLQESLRLHTQVHLLPRKLGSKPLMVYGYEIPAHSYVVLVPAATQTAATLYANPLSFDPDRHIGTTTDVPFANVPFGGGERICPGRNLAMLEMIQIIYTLAKRELEGKKLQLTRQLLWSVQTPLHRPLGRVKVEQLKRVRRRARVRDR